MIHELIYTSAERGLQPGSAGFCTVASTQAIPRKLVQVLESLSTYQHVHSPGSPQNPVVYSYLNLQLGADRFFVLSRIADAGFDYSGRSNFLAHHVALDAGELVPAGPAWLMLQPTFFQTRFDGAPRVLAESRRLPKGMPPPTPCQQWAKLAGDAGFAGQTAEALHGGSSVTLVMDATMPALNLVGEVVGLLEDRWQAAFSTHAAQLPPGIACPLRCVANASEVTGGRGGVVFDLTHSLGPAPQGVWAEAARSGRAPSVGGALSTASPRGAATLQPSSAFGAELGRAPQAQPRDAAMAKGAAGDYALRPPELPAATASSSPQPVTARPHLRVPTAERSGLGPLVWALGGVALLAIAGAVVLYLRGNGDATTGTAGGSTAVASNARDDGAANKRIVNGESDDEFPAYPQKRPEVHQPTPAEQLRQELQTAREKIGVQYPALLRGAAPQEMVDNLRAEFKGKPDIAERLKWLKHYSGMQDVPEVKQVLSADISLLLNKVSSAEITEVSNFKTRVLKATDAIAGLRVDLRKSELGDPFRHTQANKSFKLPVDAEPHPVLRVPSNWLQGGKVQIAVAPEAGDEPRVKLELGEDQRHRIVHISTPNLVIGYISQEKHGAEQVDELEFIRDKNVQPIDCPKFTLQFTVNDPIDGSARSERVTFTPPEPVRGPLFVSRSPTESQPMFEVRIPTADLPADFFKRKVGIEIAYPGLKTAKGEDLSFVAEIGPAEGDWKKDFDGRILSKGAVSPADIFHFLIAEKSNQELRISSYFVFGGTRKSPAELSKIFQDRSQDLGKQLQTEPKPVSFDEHKSKIWKLCEGNSQFGYGGEKNEDKKKEIRDRRLATIEEMLKTRQKTILGEVEANAEPTVKDRLDQESWRQFTGKPEETLADSFPKSIRNELHDFDARVYHHVKYVRTRKAHEKVDLFRQALDEFVQRQEARGRIVILPAEPQSKDPPTPVVRIIGVPGKSADPQASTENPQPPPVPDTTAEFYEPTGPQAKP
jgi:hypothetical protein